ncbi:MAG: N-acetylmuramoyl-L-alanine amidase family 2 [Actinomycetia bacterium]|nr:N-acetylmuramoyl-L-alanine amidase family 2 [Actinomycetes bacterium]
MKLEKRSSFGWPATAAGYANPKKGLVVHYDGNNQGLAGKPHSACRTYWKDTRRFHMGPKRGWLDIGYSFGACPHGIIFEGRGLNHVQAAQPGGNTTWYSCTFMSGDKEKPTTAQVAAFRELRTWLRGKGVGAAIRGHRDFSSTSCPGGILYKMVRDGSLISVPRPTPTPTPAPEEDDMPYGQLAEGPKAITPISLPRGRYKTIGFIADNGLQNLPAATLRVAVNHGANAWKVDKVTVDSTKGQTVVTFTDPGNTAGISVRREDAGDVHVAWEVS